MNGEPQKPPAAPAGFFTPEQLQHYERRARELEADRGEMEAFIAHELVMHLLMQSDAIRQAESSSAVTQGIQNFGTLAEPVLGHFERAADYEQQKTQFTSRPPVGPEVRAADSGQANRAEAPQPLLRPSPRAQGLRRAPVGVSKRKGPRGR